MDKILKNKLLVGAIIVVVLALVGGGAFYFMSQSKTANETVIEEVENVKALEPEDLGLELESVSDGKIIKLTASKLTGVESIEYEVSYDAEVVEGGGEPFTATRGVTGGLTIKAGESEVSKDIDLGTCSRNVCKYDKVISDVTFNIRVNYTDGTVGGIETKIKLEQ